MTTENQQSEPQNQNSFKKNLGALILFVALSYLVVLCTGGDKKSTSNTSPVKMGTYFGERNCRECGAKIGAYDAGWEHIIGECYQPDTYKDRGYTCSLSCCEKANSRTKFKKW